MIAVDTNLLVYAHRVDVDVHEPALASLSRAASLAGGWAIPWPCVHEFLAVVTGPAFRDARTPVDVAFEALRGWLSHPRCRAIGESAHHLDILAGLSLRGSVAGGAVHDARIAAICIGHGIEELWTCDRDFARFPDLRIRDPLIPTLREPAGSAYRSTLPQGARRARR